MLQTRPHTICKLVCDLSCSTTCRLVITAVCSQATLGQQADTIYQETRNLLIVKHTTHTFFSVLQWSGVLLSGCGVSRAGRAADQLQVPALHSDLLHHHPTQNGTLRKNVVNP